MPCAKTDNTAASPQLQDTDHATAQLNKTGSANMKNKENHSKATETCDTDPLMEERADLQRGILE